MTAHKETHVTTQLRDHANRLRRASRWVLDYDEVSPRPFARWAAVSLAGLFWSALGSILGAVLAGVQPTTSSLRHAGEIIATLMVMIPMLAFYAWFVTDLGAWLRWMTRRLSTPTEY